MRSSTHLQLFHLHVTDLQQIPRDRYHLLQRSHLIVQSVDLILLIRNHAIAFFVHQCRLHQLSAQLLHRLLQGILIAAVTHYRVVGFLQGGQLRLRIFQLFSVTVALLCFFLSIIRIIRFCSIINIRCTRTGKTLLSRS